MELSLDMIKIYKIMQIMDRVDRDAFFLSHTTPEPGDRH